MKMSPTRSDLPGFLCLSGAAIAVYLSLQSINYDSNGIVIARTVEAWYLIQPNHMLFEAIGLILLQGWGLVGGSGQAFALLQTLAAVAGGLAVGGVYLLARRFEADRLQAVTAAIWFGTTWSGWKWSTNVAYIGTAAMIAVFILLLLWKEHPPRVQASIGALAAFATLAWQANVFLLGALLTGNWFRSKSRGEAARRSLVLLTGFGITLAVAYGVMSIFRDPSGSRDVFTWLTSYGGGRSSLWGRWGWDRIGSLASTWIHGTIGWIPLEPAWFLSRPVRFDTVFPRLAPLALAIFFILPLARFVRRRDAKASWCLLGVGAYLPFILWWDPFETKWMLVPNLFLAVFAARLWSGVRAYMLAPIVVAIMAVSNLAVYGIPEHTRLSPDYRVGTCVAEHLDSTDLYVATDWAFGDYIFYRYGRNVLSFIGVGAGLGFDRVKSVEAVARDVSSHQSLGGDAYIPDPAVMDRSWFNVLETLVGVTPSDLDRAFPGEVAFTCEGWSIRRIDNGLD